MSLADFYSGRPETSAPEAAPATADPDDPLGSLKSLFAASSDDETPDDRLLAYATKLGIEPEAAAAQLMAPRSYESSFPVGETAIRALAGTGQSAMNLMMGLSEIPERAMGDYANVFAKAANAGPMPLSAGATESIASMPKLAGLLHGLTGDAPDALPTRTSGLLGLEPHLAAIPAIAQTGLGLARGHPLEGIRSGVNELYDRFTQSAATVVNPQWGKDAAEFVEPRYPSQGTELAKERGWDPEMGEAADFLAEGAVGLGLGARDIYKRVGKVRAERAATATSEALRIAKEIGAASDLKAANARADVLWKAANAETKPAFNAGAEAAKNAAEMQERADLTPEPIPSSAPAFDPLKDVAASAEKYRAEHAGEPDLPRPVSVGPAYNPMAEVAEAAQRYLDNPPVPELDPAAPALPSASTATGKYRGFAAESFSTDTTGAAATGAVMEAPEAIDARMEGLAKARTAGRAKAASAAPEGPVAAPEATASPTGTPANPMAKLTPNLLEATKGSADELTTKLAGALDNHIAARITTDGLASGDKLTRTRLLEQVAQTETNPIARTARERAIMSGAYAAELPPLLEASPAERAALRERLDKSGMRTWDKINAGQALDRMLDGGPKPLQNFEIRNIAKAFPEIEEAMRRNGDILPDAPPNPADYGAPGPKSEPPAEPAVHMPDGAVDLSGETAANPAKAVEDSGLKPCPTLIRG